MRDLAWTLSLELGDLLYLLIMTTSVYVCMYDMFAILCVLALDLQLVS